jgi:hypothetical protein
MARRHLRRLQTGAALLIFLVLLIMGVLTYLVNNLSPETLEAQRERITREALTQARDALIGYALRYREEQAAQTPPKPDRPYGFLPMPDPGTSRFNSGQQNPSCNTEGCAMDFINGSFPGQHETIVGRLPWKTLGLPPLRDGYGECLWYVVSAHHKSLEFDPNIPMNWDTLGHLDVVVANGTNALNSMLANAHDRPVAIIYAPGSPLPGQDRSDSATDDITACRGNYDAANYLDPVNAANLAGVSNYLGGAKSASGVTGDSDLTNDPDAPKPMLTGGKVFNKNGKFLASGCADDPVDPAEKCHLLANDQGLAITADHLFGAVRKNANFRLDINSLLDRMVGCLRDQIVVSGNLTNGKIADSPTACYSTATHPRGYYPHWRETIFVTGPATVNGPPCAGALLFAGQRSSGQVRISVGDKAVPANYLEGSNQTEYAAGTNNFIGPLLFDRVGPAQTAEQDIVRCIPAGPSYTTVTSPTLTSLGFGQLVAYDPATSTLVLGHANVTTGAGAPAGALFGCAWTPEAHDLGSGFRGYFQFKFKKLGTSVGLNGFTFALADALKNGLSACGAAGSHLGYSGNNGVTPPIAFPKVAVEFDQSRNSGFNEDPFNPGRNDPCGVSSCGGTAGYNSHAAILYWGHQTAGADGVTLPDNDDNVHGYPATVPASHPPPVNPPGGSAGIAFVDMRGQSSGDSHLFHVRIDVIPTRTLAAAAQDSSTSFVTKVWIVPSATLTPQVIAMQNTTSPVTSFAPTLQDTAVLYDVPVTGSFCNTVAPCLDPATQTCGTDNVCYRQALQKLRAGFTNSQRTTDQEITISNIITTWMQ